MHKSTAFLIAAVLLSISRPPWIAQAEPSIGSPPIESLDLPKTFSEDNLALADLPFIENVGQFAEAARFYARDIAGRTVWIGQDAIWITLLGDRTLPSTAGVPGEHEASPGGSSGQPALVDGVNLRLQFVGMNPAARLVPFDPQSGSFNFLLGDDPELWYPAVPSWGGVRYLDFYPGLDLEVTSEAGALSMRVIARMPEALRQVELRVQGQAAMRLASDRLILETALGEVELPLLEVEVGSASAVPEPELLDDIVRRPFVSAPSPIRVAPDRHPSQRLDSPPGSIHYSTLLGGAGAQFGQAIAVDASGSAYVAGATYSADFPATPGAFQTEFGGGVQPSDAYVAKFTADGSDLIYATFLGGSGDDRGYGLDIDGDGAVYVAGHTNSSDFPATAGAYDETHGGGLCGVNDHPCFDAFVAKLNPAGSDLEYASYIGGDIHETAWDVAIDPSGAAYVAGYAQADDFQGFLKKVSPDGSTLEYTVVLDGSQGDSPRSVDVNSNGEVLVSGATSSPDFPVTPGAYDTDLEEGFCGLPEEGGPCQDAFVAKIDGASGAISYATFLGGSGSETWVHVAVDPDGNAFVLGQTSSTDFPTTAGVLQPSYAGGSSDAFLSKLNPAGSDLAYSTYRGGGGLDFPGEVAVNASGWAYILYHSDGSVSFEQVNAGGSALLANASLNGSGLDAGNGIAIQGCCAFITGYTQSSDFPTTPGAFQTSFGGASDAFVAKIEALVDLDHTAYTQQQGFDKCVHPNLAEMQTWWTYSEYRYIGIYIGGASRYCDQPDLDGAWLSTANAQGWAFIPIWVGPQAPRWANPGDPIGERRVCADRDFGSQIDLDPETARLQGIQEAGDAVEAAYQLGLVGENRMGTILYFDLERYRPEEPECEAAVNAFIEGWVDELHNLGNQAGIYGHHINVDAWYGLTPRPDAVWFAYYPRQQCPDPLKGAYCYDANIEVYGIPTLPDDHWEQERLRQYNNSHRESYGDLEFVIDSDAADGIVAVPAGADPGLLQRASASLPQSAPLSGLPFVVQKLDLLTADVGWAIINNRLRWTTDGGGAWQDITPVAGTILQDVLFLNTSDGWAISAEVDGSGLVEELYLSSTTDAGQSWQTVVFDAFDLSQGVAGVYLDFVDSQSGWVVVRLPSSANFSFGQLFQTTDGGVSWTQLDVPLGEPVNFITDEDGWVAGGPAGDELWVTRDGGATWDPQIVAAKPPGGGYLVYHLPTFSNALEGILPVVVNELPDSWVEFYSTSDGGDTWNPVGLNDLDGLEVRPGTTFPIAVTEAGDWHLPIPADLPGIPPGVTELDFVSEEVGWAYVSTTVCTAQASGPQGQAQAVCTPDSQLIRTEDGGESWSENILPASLIYLPLIAR